MATLNTGRSWAFYEPVFFYCVFLPFLLQVLLYLVHKKFFFLEHLKKVEILLKQRVIADEEWNRIDSQKRSLKFHTFWKKFFGYELNVVTCGIYNLFW